MSVTVTPVFCFQSHVKVERATVAGGELTGKSAVPTPPEKVTVTGEPLLARPPRAPWAKIWAELTPGTAANRTRTEWLPPITQAAGLTTCPAETYSGAAMLAAAT